MNFTNRFSLYQARESLADQERVRVASLSQPLPKTPEHLLIPTKCRALRPFMVKLRRIEVGEEVMLPKCEAVYLAGCKKLELLP
jgi:hypothetical protein